MLTLCATVRSFLLFLFSPQAVQPVPVQVQNRPPQRRRARSYRLGIFVACAASALLYATPVMAQEASNNSGLLERLHAARTADANEATDADVNADADMDAAAEDDVAVDGDAAVSETPPLPFNKPTIAPQAPPSLRSVTVESEVALGGVTGVALGQSKIGIGADVMHSGDDIETRSTEFDVARIQPSDFFVLPEIEGNERWIRVDVGNQQVIAYEGETPVRAFIVSTGLPGTATVTGEFRVHTKVSEQVMSGDDFYLPEVKWVMYFYSEYALHGSYWHSNFGNPMSHGCVNMTNADSKWLFDFAGPVWDGETVWFRSSEENPGTRVIVHQ